MTTVERIDQIYDKMQAFPLSNILPLMLPIALESRDYEGYCILSCWLNPITKEKDTNLVLWNGIERILLQEGISSISFALEQRTQSSSTVLIFMYSSKLLLIILFAQLLSMYNKYVRPDFGKKKLPDIKYSDVKKFYNSLIIEKQFKPNSMEIIHTILHPIFQTAVRDCYIRLNPTDGVMTEIKKSHNWEKPKRHALTKSQQAAFIDYVRGHKVYCRWLPLITILIGTGCRVGEIVGLRWDDCDFQNGIIEINHNLIYRPDEKTGKCCYHITTPKTKSAIILCIPIDTSIVF